MLTLTGALRPVLTGDDADEFLTIARELRTVDPETVERRCRALLADSNYWNRFRAVEVVAHLPSGENWAALLDRLLVEPTIELGLVIASWLGRLVPQESLLAILRRGLASESPSVRLHTLDMLQGVERSHQVALASEAMADEPDTLIAERLAQFADRPTAPTRPSP